MTKKYEFVEGDEKVLPNGVTVRRIRSLAFIADTTFSPAVEVGELGGYIQSESNLEIIVSSNAWVYGNACFYGDARVYGNARVSGDAWVYGNACVYGDARVYGDACVYNDGLVFWVSKVGYENGTLTVYNTTSNDILVTRGCFIGTPDEFLTASRKKHDADTHEEYQLLIKVATSRINKAR